MDTNGMNSATSYLNSVHTTLSSSHPEVFEKFLSIMRLFKNKPSALQTQRIMQQAAHLLGTDFPLLLEGFNTLLTPGYRIHRTAPSTITIVTTGLGENVVHLEEAWDTVDEAYETTIIADGKVHVKLETRYCEENGRPSRELEEWKKGFREDAEEIGEEFDDVIEEDWEREEEGGEGEREDQEGEDGWEEITHSDCNG